MLEKQICSLKERTFKSKCLEEMGKCSSEFSNNFIRVKLGLKKTFLKT